MRNIQFLFFILLVSLATSCSLDEDPLPDMEQVVFNLNEDFQDWLVPFDSVGQMIQYRNSEDSLSVIEVERTYNRGTEDYADCRVEDRQVQCEFKLINVAFPEDAHPDNYQLFISIFIIAPNDLRVMANRTGLNAAIARIIGDPVEVESEIPGNYNAIYQSNYLYNGINRAAIISENITLENVPEGAIIGPKRMILVKGIGIVEWEDYNGNLWTLEN